MSKPYTPGPWSVGHTRKSRTDPAFGPFHETPVHVGSYENRGNALAVVYLGGDGALRSDVESVEANARLIAAAPDVVKAAQLLGGGDLYLEEFGRYCFCSCCQINHGGPSVKPFHSTACNNLNAAIFKAEGRTS